MRPELPSPNHSFYELRLLSAPGKERTSCRSAQKAHSSADFRQWQMNCIPFPSGDHTRNPEALADGISSAIVGLELRDWRWFMDELTA
jgi:hypothetical protein